MQKLVSLTVGTLIITGIAIFVGHTYHTGFAAGANIVLAWFATLTSTILKSLTLKNAAAWIMIQSRKSLRPVFMKALSASLIFLLPRPTYEYIRQKAKQLQTKSLSLLTWAKTRHSWLFGQRFAVVLAVAASGLIMLASVILLGVWFVYIVGWTLIWKIALFPLIRMVESILFRMFSGFLFMTGLRPLWNRQPWIKNKKTFWRRLTVRLLRKRSKAVETAKTKLLHEKSDSTSSTTKL